MCDFRVSVELIGERVVSVGFPTIGMYNNCVCAHTEVCVVSYVIVRVYVRSCVRTYGIVCLFVCTRTYNTYLNVYAYHKCCVCVCVCVCATLY
jgi:hypothetical protein